MQHLPSYLGFSYLGRGVSPQGRPPDLERGVAPVGPPAPAQPLLLGCGVAPLGHRPDLGRGVAPLGSSCAVTISYRQLQITEVETWISVDP